MEETNRVGVRRCLHNPNQQSGITQLFVGKDKGLLVRDQEAFRSARFLRFEFFSPVPKKLGFSGLDIGANFSVLSALSFSSVEIGNIRQGRKLKKKSSRRFTSSISPKPSK